ncbi:hypothetical protein K3N28_09215 [Glycomyces sp. TRM65418]|uniref:hypothetical protein n=1 Tax=Glycomyces sp. TRM65418 TaxID=2867006 RepID=UPI001CE6233E|nr:hypothetical protein [Glycomyces sp. TRM65418]MCC3763249.1 hypothetical protein [Glycomyces sp. TRM65418]QZD57250.1 hypothetical protein K3N28_09155 [Glycomyces sp. TRM65418]
MFKLRRPAYRAVIIVHVAASVAWLGLSLCLLVLGVWATTTQAPAEQYAAGTAMSTLAGTLAIPFGAIALVSGIVLMLGTKWSLAYTWVAVKLVATAIAFALTVFSLRPGLAATAASLDPASLQVLDSQILAAPIVSSAIYLGAVVLSYVKPWGRRRAALGRARVPAPARSAR